MRATEGVALRRTRIGADPDAPPPTTAERPKVTTITCTLRPAPPKTDGRYCTSPTCETRCRVDDCTSTTINHNGTITVNPSFVAWDTSPGNCVTTPIP